MWTIEAGHRILAIARNFQTTYLKLTILDQKTKEPFKPEIICWSYVDNFIPGWPETPSGVTYSFKDLLVEEPPELTCQPSLPRTECNEMGGLWDEKFNTCRCPE